MGTVYPRGNRLWIGFKDPRSGKQRYMGTKLVVGQESEARKLVETVERKLSDGAMETPPVDKESGILTVATYAAEWIKKRQSRRLPDAVNEESRLRLHVLPVIGHMAMTEVRPRHLLDIMQKLAEEKHLAQRTMLHVYGVIRQLFKTAEIEEVVGKSPAILTKSYLPKKQDKDGSWRETAVFDRLELQTLIASAAIAPDRHLVYALQGVAGLRFGEMAGLRWSDFKQRQPLNCLHISRSYNNASTKTGRSRVVPLHPVLDEMIREWKEEGWPALMGRQPTEDDLLIPSRTGMMRSKNQGRNKFIDDLARAGLRHRRSHDLRRTFITLARKDGARSDILQHVSHGQPGGIINEYTSMPYETLCEQVAVLKISRAAPTPQDVLETEQGAGESRTTNAVTTSATTILTNRVALVAKAWKSVEKTNVNLVEASGIELHVVEKHFSLRGADLAIFPEKSRQSRIPTSAISYRPRPLLDAGSRQPDGTANDELRSMRACKV